MHINLPFSNDEEFGRLHAAIRVVLPLLPALAASSPLVEGKLTGLLDTRVDVYRTNARRIPSVTGQVIPEAVFTPADYRQQVLAPLYAELAPLDPEGILRHEWANARGAIARFERNAIEIRLLDLQECPQMDIAIAATVVGALKQLVSENWSSQGAQRALGASELLPILLGCIKDADEAVVTDQRLLDVLGYPGRGPARAGDIWRSIVERLRVAEPGIDEWRSELDVLLTRGCLARRITRAVGQAPSRERLFSVYQEIERCLERGKPFRAEA
jgi:hypothetical protein